MQGQIPTRPHAWRGWDTESDARLTATQALLRCISHPELHHWKPTSLHEYFHEIIAPKSCFRRILRPSTPWRRRLLMPWLMSITFPWFWIKLPLAIQTIMVIHRMLPLVFKFSTGKKKHKWIQMVSNGHFLQRNHLGDTLYIYIIKLYIYITGRLGWYFPMQLPKCCEWSKDNLRFDSVWRNGQRVWGDELAAARSGAYVLWKEEKTSYRSYSCSVSLSDPNGPSVAHLQHGGSTNSQNAPW